MTTVDVQSPTGDVSGTIELPSALFDVKVNIPLVHQVVVAQLAAARQGTHDTKNRGEVRGGGRKPYRQKGTGRARQGSTRAPQFVGGGTVHGPTPRSYAQRTPKKMKAAALRAALSDRARGGRLHVVSALVDGDLPSTRSAAATLANIASSRHVLVVVDRADTLTWKSLRNVAAVHLIAPDQLNTYDVLVSDDVVFTESALAAYVEGKRADGELVEVPVTKPAAKPVKKAAAKKTAAAKPAADKPAAKKAPAKKAATEVVEAEVTEPEAVSTEPEAVSTEPEAVSTEPEAVSTEPEAVSTEPEAVSTEPAPDVSEPEVSE
jgi:large subunit ribosomal protein L4